MYDQFGTADPQGFGGAGGPFGGQNGYYSYSSSGFDGFGDFSDLGDIFSSFFGGGFSGRHSSRANQGPRKGADLRYDLEISFEEAFLGTEKYVNLIRNETCPTCHGEGAKPGTKKQKCTVCGGTGQVKQVQTTILRTNANCKAMY